MKLKQTILTSKPPALIEIFCEVKRPSGQLNPADQLFLKDDDVTIKVINTLDEKDLINYLQSIPPPSPYAAFFRRKDLVVKSLIEKVNADYLYKILSDNLVAYRNFFFYQGESNCQLLIGKLTGKQWFELDNKRIYKEDKTINLLLGLEKYQAIKSLVNVLTPDQLLNILRSKAKVDSHTYAHQFFRTQPINQDLQKSLIDRLDSKSLSIIAQLEGNTWEINFYPFEDILGDSTPLYHALMDKLEASDLAAICQLVHRSGKTYGDIIFNCHEIKESRAFLDKLGPKFLLEVLKPIKFAPSSTLGHKQLAGNYREFLTKPEYSVQENPMGFIQFIRDHIEKWLKPDDFDFLERIIQNAMKVSDRQKDLGKLKFTYQENFRVSDNRFSLCNTLSSSVQIAEQKGNLVSSPG